MFLVDSNHWVFYLDALTPEHARVAPRLRALLGEEELLNTTVVQLEVAHYVVRHLEQRAPELLADFFALPGKVEGLDAADVHSAVEILTAQRAWGIGGRDASVLHAARKHGVSLLCTHDRPLAKAARKMGLAVRDLAAA